MLTPFRWGWNTSGSRQASDGNLMLVEPGSNPGIPAIPRGGTVRVSSKPVRTRGPYAPRRVPSGQQRRMGTGRLEVLGQRRTVAHRAYAYPGPAHLLAVFPRCRYGRTSRPTARTLRNSCPTPVAEVLNGAWRGGKRVAGETPAVGRQRTRTGNTRNPAHHTQRALRGGCARLHPCPLMHDAPGTGRRGGGYVRTQGGSYVRI